MKTYKLFFLIILVILIGGCGAKKNNTYENIDQLVSDAQLGINKVTVQELSNILDHGSDFNIIDCRENDEFIEGHIPGAINIPRGILEFSSKISNRRETLFVYSQANDRAALACRALKLTKHSKVFLIEGGWQQWKIAFPEQIEEGDSETGNVAAPKVEESGGCGG